MRILSSVALHLRAPLWIGVCALSFTPVLPAAGQELSELSLPPNGMNQKAEISQWVGLVKVTITYHSPNVHGVAGRDRTGHIWGELVKYGMFDDGFGPSKAAPWRAGANETTTISFSHTVKIGGKDVPAGPHRLFLQIGPPGPWGRVMSAQKRRGGDSYDFKNYEVPGAAR